MSTLLDGKIRSSVPLSEAPSVRHRCSRAATKIQATYRGRRTRDRVVQSALAAFDEICRDIADQCPELTADYLCGGPISLPRRWRDDCDCDEYRSATAEGIAPPRSFSTAYPDDDPVTGEDRKAPTQMTRLGGPMASTTKAEAAARFNSPPVDVVEPASHGDEWHQKKEKERGQARQKNQPCGETANASARKTTISKARIKGASTMVGTRIADGHILTPFLGSVAAPTELATDKSLPEQRPPRPSTTKNLEGNIEMVDEALDVGDTGSTQRAAVLGGGVIVNRKDSVCIAGDFVPECAIHADASASHREIRLEENRLAGAVGNYIENKIEHNNAAGLPVVTAVEAGGEDDGDELTYSDCEDGSSAAALEQSAACEPTSPSNTTAGEEVPVVESVGVNRDRKSLNLASAPPLLVSLRAPEGGGENLSRPPRSRVNNGNDTVHATLSPDVIRGDHVVDIRGACGVTAEAIDCASRRITARRESAHGVEMALTQPGLSVDDNLKKHISAFPGVIGTPSNGEGEGTERGGLVGNLSWSIGSSSFEATPLRGEQISAALAEDTAFASLASRADPDDVILSAKALLGQVPAGVDIKSRVDWLGWETRKPVGITSGPETIDGPAAVRDTDPVLGGDTAPDAVLSAARSHECQMTRVKAPKISLKAVEVVDFLSRPHSPPVEVRETPRLPADIPWERVDRDLLGTGVHIEEHRRLAAAIDGGLKDVTDMSTRELEEELMWIRAALKIRTPP